MIRGIRGATTVNQNEAEEIVVATRKLLEEMIELNDVEAKHISSVIISTTEDLDAEFPAKALRHIEGWTYVPVMCTREIPVPHGLTSCIRIMLSAETEKAQHEVFHVYHREAKKLRPDLVE